MTQLQQPFNPAAIDPTQGGAGAMPIGKYPVVIVASQLKATSDGTGGMLVLELQREDGSVGVHRLNIYNKSDDARRIAEKQLSAICHAVGYFQILENVQAIHGRPFGVDVQLQKGEDAAAKGYTEVKRILNADGTDIVAGGQGGASQAPTPSPAPAPTAAAPAAGNGWVASPPSQAPAPSPSAGGWASQAPAPSAAPAASGWSQSQGGPVKAAAWSK